MNNKLSPDVLIHTVNDLLECVLLKPTNPSLGYLPISDIRLLLDIVKDRQNNKPLDIQHSECILGSLYSTFNIPKQVSIDLQNLQEAIEDQSMHRYYRKFNKLS
jgi:hypothetical protein